MERTSTIDEIHYVDIALDSNSDVVRWMAKSVNLFRLDIIAARSAALPNLFKRMENKSTRIVSIKKNCLIYTIAAPDTIQYQLLEAMLLRVYNEFVSVYGMVSIDSCSGMLSMFNGFESAIPALLQKAIDEDVIWVKADCRICKQNYRICLKKSLITEAVNFPVSVVFLHQGHGILLYLDANSKVRSAELVETTG